MTIISQTANSYQDSGVANAYVLSQSGSLSQASVYFEGEIITFETANSNSGATTVNKAALGVKKILTVGGSVMVGGEILAGRINFIKYDSTADGGSGAYIFISNSDLWAQNNILHVQEKQASGVDAGPFNAGARVVRVLNSIVTNTIIGATLISNKIGLPSGSYLVVASAPARNVARHQAFVHNLTDIVDIKAGTSAITQGGSTTRSEITKAFKITGAKEIILEHECQTTTAIDGLGAAASFGDEIYSDVMILRTGE